MESLKTTIEIEPTLDGWRAFGSKYGHSFTHSGRTEQEAVLNAIGLLVSSFPQNWHALLFSGFHIELKQITKPGPEAVELTVAHVAEEPDAGQEKLDPNREPANLLPVPLRPAMKSAIKYLKEVIEDADCATSERLEACRQLLTYNPQTSLFI
jgi:hypothetical protein